MQSSRKHARQGLQLSERRLPNVLSYGNSLTMQVAAIILEEREERALRKAEMEAQKVGGGAAVVLHGYGRQQGGSGLQVSVACFYRGRWHRTRNGSRSPPTFGHVAHAGRQPAGARGRDPGASCPHLVPDRAPEAGAGTALQGSRRWVWEVLHCSRACRRK